MRVLITGVTGLLGRYLVASVGSDVEVHGVSRGNWPSGLEDKVTMHSNDMRSIEGLIALVNAVKPDAVIHAAAEGSVDAVEGHSAAHHWLNVELPIALAAHTRRLKSSFTHISSNAVFGGSTKPYSDAAAFSAVNDYGRLKAEAETGVMDSHPGALIIRPILMYGWPYPGTRRNPVINWIGEMRSGRRVRVVDDVVTEPLAAWDCASATWLGIARGLSGPMNVSGGQAVTLYEFARLTCSAFALDSKLVEAVPSSSFPTLAPRPTSTLFDLQRLRDELRFQPTNLTAGLTQMANTENFSWEI